MHDDIATASDTMNALFSAPAAAMVAANSPRGLGQCVAAMRNMVAQLNRPENQELLQLLRAELAKLPGGRDA